MPIGIEFQRRYATIVLELEQLNKDLNKVLHKVQQYCYEVGEVQTLPLRACTPPTLLLEAKYCYLDMLENSNKANISIGSFSRTIFYIYFYSFRRVFYRELSILLTFVSITKV